MNRRGSSTRHDRDPLDGPGRASSRRPRERGGPRSGRTTPGPEPFGDPDDRPQVLGILDLVENQQEPLSPFAPASGLLLPAILPDRQPRRRALVRRARQPVEGSPRSPCRTGNARSRGRALFSSLMRRSCRARSRSSTHSIWRGRERTASIDGIQGRTRIIRCDLRFGSDQGRLRRRRP